MSELLAGEAVGRADGGVNRKKPDGSTTRERMVRQERHKTHTICHLAVGLIRNRWINDTLLKASLRVTMWRDDRKLTRSFGTGATALARPAAPPDRLLELQQDDAPERTRPVTTVRSRAQGASLVVVPGVRDRRGQGRPPPHRRGRRRRARRVGHRSEHVASAL